MLSFPEHSVTTSVVRSGLDKLLADDRRVVPRSIAQLAIVGHEAEATEWISSLVSGGYDPGPEAVLAASKSRHGVRPIPLWGTVEDVMYATLTNLASTSDRPPRLDYDTFLRSPTERRPTYVVAADIASCYQYIDHSILVDELAVRSGHRVEVQAIADLLIHVTGRTYGLPQASKSSDLLADAYLDIIQRAVLRRGLDCWRYSDDFRFAVDTWSEAVESTEMLDEEARKVGLTLNDAKTVPFLLDTYENTLNSATEAMDEIAEEAALDLTDFEVTYEGDVLEIEPEAAKVEVRSCQMVLQLWSALAGGGRSVLPEERGRYRAVLKLLPLALGRSRWVLPEFDEFLVRNALQLLRFEQQLTPAVIRFFTASIKLDTEASLTLFAELLREDAYLTRWQRYWVLHALLHASSLRTSDTGDALTTWVTKTLQDERNPDHLRCVAALVLAREDGMEPRELGLLYDTSVESARPLVCAALGARGVESPVAGAMVAESPLNTWAYEWGQSLA